MHSIRDLHPGRILAALRVWKGLDDSHLFAEAVADISRAAFDAFNVKIKPARPFLVEVILTKPPGQQLRTLCGINQQVLEKCPAV